MNATPTPLCPEARTEARDYQRIAQAIAFMRQHYRSRPDLSTVAQQVGLSEYHFQWLFTQWAGISPKRFWQFLTLEYAKSKIAESKSLLDLTLDAGLTSPGRLHDLFVTLAAVSPGELKAQGAGLCIRYGIYDTPFGQALIAATERGICNLHFLDNSEASDPESLLRREWYQAELVLDQAGIQAIATRIFAPATQQPPQPLVLWVKGTNFQVQIWRALLNIPPGGMTTYQQLAAAVGRPSAARAVGNAVGSNPIAYIIPCHRVLRESGELGGYRWGLPCKNLLLGWEASRLTAPATEDQ